MSSIKRRHTPSPSQTSSPSRTPKALRVSAPVRSPLLCTLPPTCHLPNRATPLSDSHALEVHYATHHAHVCSSQGCGYIFPDARLLELVRSYLRHGPLSFAHSSPMQHIAECHNPLAAILRERGDKTVCIDTQPSVIPFLKKHLPRRKFYANATVCVSPVFLSARFHNTKSKTVTPHRRTRISKGILLCSH